MSAFARKLAFTSLVACFALALGASPAWAQTHHKHHAKTHHVKHHAKSRSNEITRIVQKHLANLGYYSGKIDGIMGAKTRAAIKAFQRDHGLKADGVAGPKTRRALESADHPTITSRPLTQENIKGSEYAAQDYQTTLNGGTKTIASRFARVDVSETGLGSDKRYSVNVNGQPVLEAEEQPSVIGISPTYDLGDEDAIIFTTFSPNSSECIYSTHVLAVNSANANLLDIQNCTRNYEAQIVSGSLYISFPEQDDGRALGATWRLQGMDLEKL